MVVRSVKLCVLYEEVARMERFMPIISRWDCCKLSTSDIIYIESDGRRAKVVTEGKEFLIYAKLSELCRYFENDIRFFLCNRGMLINFDYVNSMKDQVIYFSDGGEYLMGRESFIRTKQTFANYLKKTLNY